MNPTVKNTFSPRGLTPELMEKRRCCHQKLSVISAIVLTPKKRQADLVFQILPANENFTTETVLEFVRGIVKRNPYGKTHVIWDRAQIHRGKAFKDYLSRSRRIQCHHFPPYSPELNPVELVWSYVKWQDLANSVPKDMDSLLDDVSNSMVGVAEKNDMLKNFVVHATKRPS